MIKKAKLALITTSAILLAACTAQTPPSGDQETTASPGSEQNITASVRELLGMGKNVKCTFSTSETDDGVKTDTSGTVYISGKNMAEDVQVVSSDKEVGTVSMKMISDGTTVYSWNPAIKTQGIKMSYSEIDTKDGQTADKTTPQQEKNLDEKVDMKCSGWNVDNTVFSVPADVKFSDLTEMMKNIPTVPANIPNYGGVDGGE